MKTIRQNSMGTAWYVVLEDGRIEGILNSREAAQTVVHAQQVQDALGRVRKVLDIALPLVRSGKANTGFDRSTSTEYGRSDVEAMIQSLQVEVLALLAVK